MTLFIHMYYRFTPIFPLTLHYTTHGFLYGCFRQLFFHQSSHSTSLVNVHGLQCAINFSSEDIPNGIGFGGRVNHYGLFLSANFDQGHSFSCSTFGSPCLSKTNRILPEVIECWGVTEGSVQGKNGALKGTILERFKEDRHMLNMVGLANSSE